MAVVTGSLAYHIIDSDNLVSTVFMPFSSATGLLADIQLSVTANALLLDAVLGAQILKVTAITNLVLPGVKGAPVAGSKVEETALFSMNASNTLNAYGVDLPGALNTIFTRGKVNLANASVVAFLPVLQTVSNGVGISDRYFNKLNTVKAATQTFRKRRRALKRA